MKFEDAIVPSSILFVAVAFLLIGCVMITIDFIEGSVVKQIITERIESGKEVEQLQSGIHPAILESIKPRRPIREVPQVVFDSIKPQRTSGTAPSTVLLEKIKANR